MHTLEATPPNLRRCIMASSCGHYLRPDDYNQQPFRETTLRARPRARARALFYFPFERREPSPRHVTAITALFVGTYVTV